MAVIETWLPCELKKPVQIHTLCGSLYSNNGNANRIGAIVTEDGEPASLSGTVSGYAVLSNGTTVPCTGTLSSNKASILLPAAAYLPGSVFITVFITSGTTVTTLAAVNAQVVQSRTDSQVDPGSVVTDWTTTINAAMQAVETAAENIGHIVATPYASLSFPVPLGKYTFYNNNLYRCTTPIATSEDFTAAHWSAAINLGDELRAEVAARESADSDLKCAINAITTKSVAFVDGYAIRSTDGAKTTPSGFSYAEIDVLTVAGGVLSGYTSASKSATNGLAFYDKNGEYISGEINPVTNTYAWNIENIAIPANAAVLRVSCRTAYKDNFYLNYTWEHSNQNIENGLKNSYQNTNEIAKTNANLQELNDKIMQHVVLHLSDLTYTNGYYIRASDGAILANGNFKYSDLIDVVEGVEIEYSLHGINNVTAVIAAYDANGNYVNNSSVVYDSSYSSGATVLFSGTYTVSETIKKIRICNWTTAVSADDSISIPYQYSKVDKNVQDINTIKEAIDTFDVVNNWKDKKWVAFGTSITDNYSQNSYITQGEHAGEHTGKYVPYLLALSELSESSFVNRGIAGGSINGHILYYIRYYSSDESTADLITIEGAVNDFANSVPLGSVGDTVPYTNSLLPDSTAQGTFAGACYQAFTTALTNAPKAVVVLLTETTGKNHVGYANYNQLRKNSLNLTQWDYIDMTIKVAKFVGIPVIECGSESMINAENPQYIADHIHHTYLGGYQYARTIWAKLKGIPLKALTVPE